ncbi:hypothetical protein C8A05DRAFT_44490 [Staphylotrichum tortipilum]|uniref:DUF8035 domain-containing protein n=1 Tax=Staphylotrichum tortipilum TaxID=2831512 RepID=A0AAN6MKQ9_9PEZI|nr:hypothetical protein C8A05DRAFT_44490 [Staphylotrichum longicolle]
MSNRPDRERDRDRDRDSDSELTYSSRRRGGPPPPRDWERERELDRRFHALRVGRDDDDDEDDRQEGVVIRERSRERRRVVRRSSPPPLASGTERVVLERQRARSPSPGRPPRLVRRQSSLDTFDREPVRRYWEREEYGPPARRDDIRLPPYGEVPLPRVRVPSPPREVYAEREFRAESRVSDPPRYGTSGVRMFPEQVREREIVRTTRLTGSRSRSREGKRRHRSRSSSSSSSSGGGTALTSKSEYPKKGKTRIPTRLVSKRALRELRYPFVEEGNKIIVQLALGRHNIDHLLKLSVEYKKSEVEILAPPRASSTDIVAERVDRRTEVYTVDPPRPSASGIVAGRLERRTEVYTAEPTPPPRPVSTGHGPIIIQAGSPDLSPVEITDTTTTLIRDVSPIRTTYARYDYPSSPTTILDIDTVTHEVSTHVPLGPIALASDSGHRHHHHHHHHRHHSRHRSHSRHHSHRRHHSHSHSHDLRDEVYETDGYELAIRRRSRSRSRSRSVSHGALVRAERLSTGELVVYEEDLVELEPVRAGPRIEKDRRGVPPALIRAMAATLT